MRLSKAKSYSGIAENDAADELAKIGLKSLQRRAPLLLATRLSPLIIVEGRAQKGKLQNILQTAIETKHIKKSHRRTLLLGFIANLPSNIKTATKARETLFFNENSQIAKFNLLRITGDLPVNETKAKWYGESDKCSQCTETETQGHLFKSEAIDPTMRRLHENFLIVAKSYNSASKMSLDIFRGCLKRGYIMKDWITNYVEDSNLIMRDEMIRALYKILSQFT